MKKFILKKISVLFILSLLVIFCCVYFFLFEFRASNDFGMAGIGALILLGFGVFGLILDYILSRVIEDRTTLNIIEFIMIFFISIWILLK